MTNQQGAPDALRTITRYEVVDCIDSKHVPAVIPNKDGPWVRYEDHLAALVEAQQPDAHVQNPAEIEHVVGDVSKNGPESNMAQQPAPTPQADSAPASVAGPMQFGGCPECGSRSCVARECSRTVSHTAQAIPGVQWQCGPRANGFTTPQADSAQDEPLQAFDSPRARALMRAWEEGWAACRDAEYVGEEAQNDAFNSSHTLTLCIAEDQQLSAPQADIQPVPQGETNVQLDTDSNHSAPGQQRDVAGSVALGQPVGNGSDQAAGHTGAQGDKLLIVAERNIRSFLRSAVFKSESDREAALNCVDVLWEAARAPADSVTAPAGWQAVPVTPTSDQLNAACEPFLNWQANSKNTGGPIQSLGAAIYRAMLSAAPTQAAQAADSVLEDAARLLESQHTWLTNVAAANLVRSLAARKQGGAT